MEIACIVEDDREFAALPTLIQRIIASESPGSFVQVAARLRWPRSRLVTRPYLERAVRIAAERATSAGAILVLLDADDDCPATLGPQLLDWATTARHDMHGRIAVVLANREYESWFLASADLLHGPDGLRAGIRVPGDSESRRGAKEWLSQNMIRGERYRPTTHQRVLSQRIGIRETRQRSDSFDKLCREIQRLVEAIRMLEP
ncbi:MAG: DUF4276 family protein [Chloroflexi bacterium]|nr:DUF4276 family protein [Chloroflexota bacterium]